MSDDDFTQARPGVHPIEDENRELIPLKINEDDVTKDLAPFLAVATVVLVIGAYFSWRYPWFKNSRNGPHILTLLIGTIISLYVPAIVSYRIILRDPSAKLYVTALFLLLMISNISLYFFFLYRVNPTVGIILSIVNIILILGLMYLIPNDMIGFLLMLLPIAWSMYTIYWAWSVKQAGSVN